MSDDLRIFMQRGWELQRIAILDKAGIDPAGVPETSLSFFLWARQQDAKTQAKLHAAGWTDVEVHTCCSCRACTPVGWCQ